MEDCPLESIPLAGPVIDAADFCRPLATISGVELQVDLGDSERASVQSNTLRMEQVRKYHRLHLAGCFCKLTIANVICFPCNSTDPYQLDIQCN